MKLSSTTLFTILLILLISVAECKPSIKCLAYILELKAFY